MTLPIIAWLAFNNGMEWPLSPQREEFRFNFGSRDWQPEAATAGSQLGLGPDCQANESYWGEQCMVQQCQPQGQTKAE